jgi:LPS-assembly protein
MLRSARPGWLGASCGARFGKALFYGTLISAHFGALQGAHAQGTADPARLELRLDRGLSERAIAEEVQTPTYARGNRLSGRPDRDLTLEGDAEVRRADLSLRANRLTYYQADDEVVAVGDVRLVREGLTFVGPQLRLRIDANTGNFDQPKFTVPVYGGRGQAERVDFLGPQRLSLVNGFYTTCQAADPDWYLKTKTLSINETQQTGQGSSASLVFKGQQIFAAPSFSFPLGDGRRSGFLAPTFTLSNRTGAEILSPFYWNIAPNRDFTAFTRLSGRRGIQLGGQFRYLEPSYFGEARFELNPRDQVSGTQRYFWSSQTNFSNWMGWSGSATLRGVSDDNYFVDYSRSILASSERSLPRDVIAARGFGDWTVSIRAQRFQNILDARAAPPYERLPQVAATLVKRDVNGFDFILPLDATVFVRPILTSPEGARLVANPQLSYPIITPGWFITPKVSMHLTSYQLSQNPGSSQTSFNRAVPTVSLDAGLVFEREARYGNRDFVQTLEPRLFYSRTPFRDQSALPVFDTGVADFNFAQLFSENTFVGNDRIADVNQLTTAAVSRLIVPQTGAEAFRFAFGQRAYFSDQLVTIANQPARTDRRSDLLFAVGANLGNGMSLDAAMQYSLGNSDVPRFNAVWRYLPADGRIFNLGMRYLQKELGQIDGSWRFALPGRWQTMGRLNYNVLNERLDPATGVVVPTRRGVVEGVLGLEYVQDCWRARMVVQRFVTAAQTTTSQFFFQLELTGLARIGSDPFAILQRSIPGYTLPTERPVAPSRYFGYD